MPKVSIIVAAYNVGRYLPSCLASIRAQTLADVEALVVDDASTDDTGEIIEQVAQQDPRVIHITHPTNRGLHLTRKTGVEHASGQYAFFLDGDDEIQPDFCERLMAEMNRHQSDILHFGLTVIAENGILPEECRAFEAFNNTPTSDAAGNAILRNIFDPATGQQVDWRVTQRLYRTSLLKQAFELMTDARLERAEDGYECFAISALAASYHSYKSCQGYIYHYGRGVTGTNTISADTYITFCRQFKACFDATQAFTRQHDIDDGTTLYLGFVHKALELLTNDWKNRVLSKDQLKATQGMVAVFGPQLTVREIYRLIRDEAYRQTTEPATQNEYDQLQQWVRIVTSVEELPESSLEGFRLIRMKNKAMEHLTQLAQREQLKQYERQSIRIFVTTHKRVDRPKSDILQLVQVGPGNNHDRFSDTFHDDDGENISNKNPAYCELTTQYWAWKNVDAEYYGFCHYRRYFDFSSTDHSENAYGEIMDSYIDEKTSQRYGLDDAHIKSAINGYDVVTTKFQDLRLMINKLGTPALVWKAASYLQDKDLRHMYDILCAQHPDYRVDADAFLNGNFSCFCNMFIMRKDIFFDYCQWLFPILEEFENTTDTSHYSKEAVRTPGHLSERLLNIYLMHHKRVDGSWRMKELQCVHFTHPEVAVPPQPLLDVARPESIIPVVFAADNNYVPMVTTTLLSAMQHAAKDRYYDITILQRDISADNQKRMTRFFSQFNNLTLRFINVEREISGYNLSTNNQHISVETYYRFLIQQVLPFYSKVLYLDSDIVINDDISKLFDTDLEDNLLAACRDIDYLGNLNVKFGNKRMSYTKNILGMTNPYDYFQAGVLVLNTKAMRAHYTTSQWLKYASNSKYIYNDQDVLNVHCQGKVKYLDWSWDVVHDCDGRVAKVFSFAPSAAFDDYNASRTDPKIIHYAGFIKPWTDPTCDFAEVYWNYARQTPFYEKLLKRVAESVIPNEQRQILQRHQPALGDDNPIRRIIDPLMPLGSKRREVLKAVGRLARGRK